MSIDNIWYKLRALNDNGILDSLLLLGGKLIWVDYLNGDDANYGTKDAPIKTLDGSSGALARVTAGKNDIVVLKNSGGTLAQSVVRLSAAFDWNKACTHIIAQTPVGSPWSPRASIRPNLSDTAFANFFTVSARGCLFHNIGWVTEFTAGVAASIPLTVSAPYNRFSRCQIAGMIDATSAASATSRCVKLTAGENLFENCVIGVDTIARSVANASVEFASGAARNHFKNCIFPIYATATSPLLVKVAAAAGADRFQLFEDCIVTNFGASSLKLCTLAANIGGKIIFTNPKLMGTFGGFGTDATSIAQILIDGVASGTTVTGIGYAPNA